MGGEVNGKCFCLVFPAAALLWSAFLPKGKESSFMSYILVPNPIGCTTCAKAFHAAGGNAAGLAILFLLVVIVAVLVTVAIIMVRMARREESSLDAEFRDDYNPQQTV